ncbi:MAG: hypothetical protein IAE63_00365 [Alphaproteobacteria bacterium]|jgi:hypothetical protein|nr:hypothetical protein [Alphaproteobacteria bacterium]
MRKGRKIGQKKVKCAEKAINNKPPVHQTPIKQSGKSSLKTSGLDDFDLKPKDKHAQKHKSQSFPSLPFVNDQGRNHQPNGIKPITDE